MKFIYTSILILFFAFCVSAQCSDESDCRAKLSESAQMINKLLDVKKAQDAAIEALKAENEARKQKEIIDRGIIAGQDRLILLLEKDRRKQLSFLFGLVKVRF